MQCIDNVLFKKVIVLFWAAWWVIAFWTDIVGGLAHIGWLEATWAPDVNYPFLEKCLEMYQVASWVPAVLFLGIIVWSLAAMLAFIWAALGLRASSAVWMRRAEVAFIISLSWWMAFFLADQLVMNFDLEENHMVQGGFMLLTYLAMYRLPE